MFKAAAAWWSFHWSGSQVAQFRLRQGHQQLLSACSCWGAAIAKERRALCLAARRQPSGLAILDGPGQTAVLPHSFHVQVLNKDLRVIFAEPGRELVKEIFADIGNAPMTTR